MESSKQEEQTEMSYARYCRLNVHVAASRREVIRKARSRLAPAGKSRAQRTARHAFIRAMLQEHESARELVRVWRL